MGENTTWYTWGGYFLMLLYTHLLINETRVLYGKIQDWYARVISYEYMLMYRTVVNTFRIVLKNSHKHVTTIFHYSTHVLNVSFHITQVILFNHFIGVNCISYMAPDLMSQVSNLLIYMDVIVSNIIRMIPNVLTTFSKPDMYINKLQTQTYYIMDSPMEDLLSNIVKLDFVMKSKACILTR